MFKRRGGSEMEVSLQKGTSTGSGRFLEGGDPNRAGESQFQAREPIPGFLFLSPAALLSSQ